jgi:hypothetical protein
MVATFLVIAGVLVGLVLLLAVIVGLSARPEPRRGNVVARTSWVAHAGRPHPDAWSEPTTVTSELPVVR